MRVYFDAHMIMNTISNLKRVSSSDVFQFFRHFIRSTIQIIGNGFLFTRINRVELLTEITINDALVKKKNFISTILVILEQKKNTLTGK